MKTIDLTPTWAETANIIAAVMENGTAEGVRNARAELQRMGQLLDQLRNASETPQDLCEVICDSPKAGKSPFGMTFSDEALAQKFARTMRRNGYKAEVSPVYSTEPTLAAALTSAARFFDDERLNADQAQ